MGDRGVEFIKGNEGIGAGEEKPAQAGGQLAPSPIALFPIIIVNQLTETLTFWNE